MSAQHERCKIKEFISNVISKTSYNQTAEEDTIQFKVLQIVNDSNFDHKSIDEHSIEEIYHKNEFLQSQSWRRLHVTFGACIPGNSLEKYFVNIVIFWQEMFKDGARGVSQGSGRGQDLGQNKYLYNMKVEMLIVQDPLLFLDFIKNRFFSLKREMDLNLQRQSTESDPVIYYHHHQRENYREYLKKFKMDYGQIHRKVMRKISLADRQAYEVFKNNFDCPSDNIANEFEAWWLSQISKKTDPGAAVPSSYVCLVCKRCLEHEKDCLFQKIQPMNHYDMETNPLLVKMFMVYYIFYGEIILKRYQKFLKQLTEKQPISKIITQKAERYLSHLIGLQCFENYLFQSNLKTFLTDRWSSRSDPTQNLYIANSNLSSNFCNSAFDPHNDEASVPLHNPIFQSDREESSEISLFDDPDENPDRKALILTIATNSFWSLKDIPPVV